MLVRLDSDRDAVAAFDHRDVLTLLVQHVIGDRDWSSHQHFAGPPSHTFFFQLTQDRQRQIVVGPGQTGAVAMRARGRGGFDHAGAQALA